MARFFHVTSRAAGEAILRSGFRDSTGTYGTGTAQTGVFLSSVPTWDGGPVDCLPGGRVCIEVDTDDDFSEDEWVEEGKPYREWHVSAERLNFSTRSVRLVADLPPLGTPSGPFHSKYVEAAAHAAAMAKGAGPSTPSGQARDVVGELRSRGPKANTHPAKLLVLADFVRTGFGRAIEELLPGVEKRVGSKIWAVRGSIDFLFQGSVIEIKTDFDGEVEDARRQLAKYFQSLWEESPENRYVGAVTDLTRWEVCAAVLGPKGVDHIERVGELDLRTATDDAAFLWFDALFFSGSVTVPSADDVVLRFGPGSPTYAIGIAELSEMWASVRANNASKLKLKLWNRAMEIVYGTAPSEEGLVAHTYLSILVKLLVYLRLKNSPGVSHDDMDPVLSGSYFTSRGVMNLIEEDFFAWVLEPSLAKGRERFASRLVEEPAGYDLSKANEDLFKEIYQEVVALGQRHGTGEYYTPRWLCQRTLDVALSAYSKDKFPRLLDPACGSGSFLTEAIHRLKAKSAGAAPAETLSRILSSVQGLDINPVAVTIARANYLIALGDLVRLGVELSIPVYVADSLKIPAIAPTVHGGVKAFKMDADGSSLLLPETVLADRRRLSAVLSAITESINHYRGGLKRKDARATFERLLAPICDRDEAEILDGTFEQLLMLVDTGRDSVWTFALRNLYAPITLHENPVDVMVGNPPWIVMHSIEDEGYQNFLKHEVIVYGLLDRNQTRLYTHMEMATLFFRRAADLYLAGGGYLAFLMPVSVTTGAQQHTRFNRFIDPLVRVIGVETFRTTPNVFSLPPALIYGQKGSRSKFPVKSINWTGSIALVPRNSDWSAVSPSLTEEPGTYSPSVTPTNSSPYFPKFREGATIVPHNFWFVEPAPGGGLGGNPRRPLVRTSSDVQRVAKKPWKSLVLEGTVDSEFLFACYLGKDILPFGTLEPRPVVVPLKLGRYAGEVLDSKGLKRLGFPNTAKWVEEAQALWEKHGTQKSAKNHPAMGDRLDYQKSLSAQNPSKRYLLVYNARGADICAVVLDRKNPQHLKLGAMDLIPAGIVADSTNFYFETASAAESHFLCAVLNAPKMSLAVKPFQPRGLYGARDMGRRVFKLDIKEFNPKNPDHGSLSELSVKCHALVEGVKFSGPGFQTRRREVRQALKSEIARLDRLVSKLGFDQPLV